MPTRVRSIIDNSRVPEPNIGRMREVEDYRELDSQAAMERAACNIIYLDKTAREEIVRRPSTSSASGPRTSSGSDLLDYSKADSGQHQAEIQTTLESILSTFSTVHVCHSGGSCLSKLSELQASAKDNTPTILLIDVPYDEEQRLRRSSREPRSSSPKSLRSKNRAAAESLDDIYGMHMLTYIASEIQNKKLSKLVVPIVVLSGFEREWASPNLPSPSVHGSQVLSDTVRLTRYLDAGAADVLASPLSKDNAQGLAVHAYRACKESSREDAAFLTSHRSRRLSWVGVDEGKPYGYLREAMVSNLMSGICNPEIAVGEVVDTEELDIPAPRKAAVAKAVGTWSFSAHDFTDDELLHGALVMLEHVLSMPELEKWRMTTAEHLRFLEVCRTAYNDFVLYHNFRHVVDVLQGVFYFLYKIGTIPHYPHGAHRSDSSPPPAIASLLTPIDALTLIVAAIGHDVGHPGVNNAFLVALNAPLAQLYNDHSVLESFHCAAYSQILRRYWTSAFQDISMRKLMISTILATDMGLHFKYMSDLGQLQEKLRHNTDAVELWSAKERDEYKDLVCGLLIKCADISNVARVFPVAAEWARILTNEFSRQADMEEELDIPTCLFGGPPIADDIVKLSESQQGFITIFARPLFEAVMSILPPMHFALDELEKNKTIWQSKVTENKRMLDCSCGRKDNCSCGVHEMSNGNGGPKSSQRVTAPVVDVDEAQDAPRQDSDVSRKAIGVAKRKDSRGRSISREGSSTTPPLRLNGDSTPVDKRSSKASRSIPNASSNNQRAVSAHQHSRQKHDDHDALPNGVMNPSFAASETDVRFLENGDSKSYIQENGGEVRGNEMLNSTRNGRKEKRFKGGFKRLFKRKWRHGSSPELASPNSDTPPPSVAKEECGEEAVGGEVKAG